MEVTVKSTGKVLVGRLPKGSDLLEALTQLCQAAGIQMGRVQAIGAVTRARVGYYDQAARVYNFLDFNQDLEILALVGNVSLKDGRSFVHAHVTLGDAQGQALGGHLAEGCEVFACEYEIVEYQAERPLERAWDQETGLMLWPNK
ncbi:MAG: DNA-binding protein [Desulfarculus sp.]|nr:DNA-binding protein [Desulfarculus sp.]